jgi:hypothetical protein
VATAHAGRGDLAPRLEHFESERETTWWRMIAALSLVELGERRHLRTMLDALNEGTLAEQYVPSLLLDPALIARPDVSQALLETLGEGSEAERETVAWMLPYLDTPNRDALLEVALRDPSAFVRRAAEWARETARERAAAAPAAGRESS